MKDRGGAVDFAPRRSLDVAEHHRVVEEQCCARSRHFSSRAWDKDATPRAMNTRCGTRSARRVGCAARSPSPSPARLRRRCGALERRHDVSPVRCCPTHRGEVRITQERRRRAACGRAESEQLFLLARCDGHQHVLTSARVVRQSRARHDVNNNVARNPHQCPTSSPTSPARARSRTDAGARALRRSCTRSSAAACRARRA